MSKTYDTKEQKERILLVAVECSRQYDVNNSLDELEELVATAGADTVGRLIQKREKIHPATYIGKGKIEELSELIHTTEADTILCDDELSPAQLGNLEKILQVKVIDRTVLILDIFASRAQTREGKIQVELAQLQYRSSHLVGLRNSLSRLGGTSAGIGIGNKGPGEKKLELDRRLIQNRMTHLRKEIKDIAKAREIVRKQRERNEIPILAIVGYTNAGKSTLLNNITRADVYAKDQLFATLDTTTRGYQLDNGQKILLTDTVGFINKLPHHLIDAFRSTLEEAKYADIILHVVDISNANYETQMSVVYDTLKCLGISGKPVVTVFNKIDKTEKKEFSVEKKEFSVEANEFSGEENYIYKDENSDAAVHISAKERIGFDKLWKIIKNII